MAGGLQKQMTTPGDIEFWDMELEDKEYQEAVVNNVLVSGIPTPEKYKGKNTLHWRITLECSVRNGRQASTKYISIEYAMNKTHVQTYKRKDLPVDINVALQKYGHHKDAPSQLTFPMGRSVTLSDVIRLIQAKGRNRFRTDAEGNGCLCWVKYVISDMKNQGWFRTGAYEAMYAALTAIKKNDMIGRYIVVGGEGTFF